MKASGVYQGEAMDFLTSRGRISGSVSRITLMVTMIDGGGGGGQELGSSLKGVPAAEDDSLPWGSGNKEEKKDLEVKKK